MTRKPSNLIRQIVWNIIKVGGMQELDSALRQEPHVVLCSIEMLADKKVGKSEVI